MNKMVYFTRFVTTILCIVLVAGVSLAEGGDDDKDKNGKNSKGNSVKVDSIDVLDLDIEIAQNADDTLVFEDWDNPEDDGSGIGTDNSVTIVNSDNGFSNTGSSFNNSISEFFNGDIVDALVHRKKDYKVDFTLFPNPTVNQLHLKPSHTPRSIRIADISGKEHLASNYQPKVDVAHLPVGTYFIQLVYADHIEARKFIKN